MSCVIPQERALEAYAWFPQASPHVPSPFADGNFVSFTVGPGGLPRKLVNLGAVLGTSTYTGEKG